MSDDRYDRPADMRLLELQRERLGAAPRALPRQRVLEPDVVPAPKRGAAPDVAANVGPIVVATVDAQPRTALIPGALVSVSITLANDGDAVAQQLRLNVSLPRDSAYRATSLRVDGTAADSSAGDLFGDGADLGDLDPGARKALHFKLLVEAGVGDLHLLPHLRARNTAVLGLRALRLQRAVTVARPPERPFYESDEAEHAQEAPAVRRTAIDVTVPAEGPAPAAPARRASAKPPKTPIAAAPPAPKTATDAAPPAPQPPAADRPREPKKRTRRAAPKAPAVSGDLHAGPTGTIEEVGPISVPAPPRIVRVAGAGGPLLTVRMSSARLATLDRLFRGPSMGMAAHYLLLNALTATTPLGGEGDDRGLASFVDEQEKLLSRALIATRLHRPIDLAQVGADLPAFPPRLLDRRDRVSIPAPAKGELLLLRALDEAEPLHLQRMLDNAKVERFQRASHLFVALLANDVAVVSDERRASAAQALRAYGALATREIGRIFLRGKITSKPDPFKSTDRAFDDAARRAIDGLTELTA